MRRRLGRRRGQGRAAGDRPPPRAMEANDFFAIQLLNPIPRELKIDPAADLPGDATEKIPRAEGLAKGRTIRDACGSSTSSATTALPEKSPWRLRRPRTWSPSTAATSARSSGGRQHATERDRPRRRAGSSPPAGGFWPRGASPLPAGGPLRRRLPSPRSPAAPLFSSPGSGLGRRFLEGGVAAARAMGATRVGGRQPRGVWPGVEKDI